MQREFGTSFSFVSQDQTKPTKPSTPERLKSTFQTNSSVFLSWRLAWPPTGNLDKFLLEVDKYSIQIHNTNTQHKYTIHNTNTSALTDNLNKFLHRLVAQMKRGQ